MNRKHSLRKHYTWQNHKVMHLHLWASCCVYSIHELPYQKLPLNKDIKYSTSSAVQWITDLCKDYCSSTITFKWKRWHFLSLFKLSFPFSNFPFLVTQSSLRTSEKLGMFSQVYGLSHSWRLERDCVWLENLILFHLLVSHFCPWQVVRFQNGTEFNCTSRMTIFHRT